MIVVAAVVTAGVLSVPALAHATGSATARAAARCQFSGKPIGSYYLSITLRNDTDRSATIIGSQVSGAITGTTPLADGSEGAPGTEVGTDAGPFPGDAVGTATVTFELRLQGASEGTIAPAAELVTVSASVELDGRCQGPGPDDLFAASVAPMVVPVAGTVVVSGGHCPPSLGWDLGGAPNWRVHVQLALESHARTKPPTGTGYEASSFGFGPPPFPGSVSAQTSADPLGNWSVALDLSSTDHPAEPGSYAVDAVCVGGNGLIGEIVYDTPRITVAAAVTGPVATPVVARPSLAG